MIATFSVVLTCKQMNYGELFEETLEMFHSWEIPTWSNMSILNVVSKRKLMLSLLLGFFFAVLLHFICILSPFWNFAWICFWWCHETPWGRGTPVYSSPSYQNYSKYIKVQPELSQAEVAQEVVAGFEAFLPVVVESDCKFSIMNLK